MPGLKILGDKRANKPQEVRLPTNTPPSEPARVPAKQWRPSEDDTEQIRPTIPRLFSDAAAYGKFIADPASPGGLRRPTLGKRRATVDFAELVGNDLDAPEKEQAGRFAQISAADWTSSDDDDSRTRITEEPEPLTDADSISSSSLSDDSDSAAASSTPPTSEESASDSSSAALTPDQVVRILEQEFGALAPEGEEKLVFQTDGAVIQDVVILGVVHVTTHRFAFHASMPAFDPTVSQTNDIIKAGPVQVHRKGLHRSRRVWMELSQDFVSSFPSAREEDRIRPTRSIMLTSVLEIHKEDPRHPRLINTKLDGKSGIKMCALEFDTIESAREWRREMQAAVFFSRRRMRKFFSHTNAEDMDGIRIGIPLDRVTDYSRQIHASTLPIVNFTLLTGTANAKQASNASVPADVREAEQTVQFAFPKLDEHWDQLDKLIRNVMSKKQSDSPLPSRPVVIDFGLGGGTQAVDGEKSEETTRTKQHVVCDMLAIDYTPDVFVIRGSLSLGLSCYGFLVVSSEWVGFWSKSVTLRDIKYRLQVSSIHKATPTDSVYRTGLPRHGIVLELEGRSNLKFLFRSEAARNEALQHINHAVEQQLGRRSSPATLTIPLSGTSTPSSTGSGTLTPQSLHFSAAGTFCKAKAELEPRYVLQFPKAVNIRSNSQFHIPPKHFVCLTIGSRGDVQPYIALGLGLKADGHKVTIVTHEEYKDWIEGFGLQHRSTGGDPGALMKLSVENKMFSPQFFKTSLANYRAWLDKLLSDSWESCQDAEVLLESPYAMAGVHIAEALDIPYFRVCTMPWTKTVQFPHPFISPPVDTPTFNSISYVLFDNVLWTATSSQVNRWRRESLKLDPIVMGHTAQSKIPVLYNFSPAVVPKPLDWSDSKIICGYWFLDNPDLDWTPPDSLLQFMAKAREDGKPLVYIGFGSITVPDPHSVTEHIVDAVVKSGVRAIISKGWSARMATKVDNDVVIPDSCYIVDKVPHDWLFPQIDAALHHGGAGTTGASLRAGIPTLIKPWFGDQYFWASRVQRLGAGMRVSLRVSDLAAALTRATTDRIMKEKADAVGLKIRIESGVRTALQSLYTYLPRASAEGISPE